MEGESEERKKENAKERGEKIKKSKNLKQFR
jgi:hypothetical protein